MSEIFLFTILLLLTFFQSIFGIGLLLLGTPTLFLLGFNYYETINILLPISILVSFIQVIKSKEKIKNFKIDFNFFCLPGLILGSILILNYIQNFNFKFAISILLILSSIISIKKKKFMVLRDVIGNYRKLIHFIIGLVHGMTNMGGGFLSIFSSLININKETTRKCVAHGYLLMGTFQYALLLVFFKDKLDFSRIYFAIISIFVYFSGNYFFKKISDKKFSKIIGLIVLIYGICILFVQLIN